jgi:hypothetical protein
MRKEDGGALRDIRERQCLHEGRLPTIVLPNDEIDTAQPFNVKPLDSPEVLDGDRGEHEGTSTRPPQL